MKYAPNDNDHGGLSEGFTLKREYAKNKGCSKAETILSRMFTELVAAVTAAGAVRMYANKILCMLTTTSHTQVEFVSF